MTNTQTHTAKREWIATHTTTPGFAIGIIRETPKAPFQVVRCSDKHYFALCSAKTEAEARKLANREWLKDMGRPAPEDQMIVCSPDGWYGAGC